MQFPSYGKVNIRVNMRVPNSGIELEAQWLGGGNEYVVEEA